MIRFPRSHIIRLFVSRRLWWLYRAPDTPPRGRLAASWVSLRCVYTKRQSVPHWCRARVSFLFLLVCCCFFTARLKRRRARQMTVNVNTWHRFSSSWRNNHQSCGSLGLHVWDFPECRHFVLCFFLSVRAKPRPPLR